MILALICFALFAPAAAGAQNAPQQAPYATERQPVTLFVDASRAAEGLMFVRERIPAVPGDFTIVYPKWIPGEHGPTGPLNDLAELRVSANGSPLELHRDGIDLYAFHLTVPPGATGLDVNFTVLMNAPGDHMSSHSLAVLNWNRALLYQEGIDSRHYFVKPAIALPTGWDYGTALRGAIAQRRPRGFQRYAARDAGRFAARYGSLRPEMGSMA